MYVVRERCMCRDIVYFIIYMYIYDIFRIEYCPSVTVTLREPLSLAGY